MDRLISILRRLTGLGNTVVVVEHDEAVMRAADNLIEIGPRPGINGGKLSFNGSYDDIIKSDTPHWPLPLGPRANRSPQKRRSKALGRASSEPMPLLSIYSANKHNIKDLDLHIPQQQLVCLSGVSGSGKSTLLNNVIHQNLLTPEKDSASKTPLPSRISNPHFRFPKWSLLTRVPPARLPAQILHSSAKHGTRFASSSPSSTPHNPQA